MRKYTTFCFLFVAAATLQAQSFTNGQAARAEFGQYTFTYGGATPGTSATVPNQQILGGLSGLAWANGILYVADSNKLGVISQDNRVVMFGTNQVPLPTADLTHAFSYSNASCNLCAFPAFNQLGQPGFTAGQPINSADPNAFNQGLSNDPAASNMRTPTAVASDGVHVAVADTDNNRVLIWNTIPTTINQAADVVLGQADFTHALVSTTPTASSLRGPAGVWFQNGKLFVADTQDYRVLIWNTIPTANNAPADVVLGQTNFNGGSQSACNPVNTTTTVVTAANELCNPVSVTADASHLYVADLGFNRVLIWNSIPTANGQNADVVLGQPDMTNAVPNNPNICLNTGAQNVCPSNLNYPRFALSDGTRLFVADGGNDRVLIYNTIPTQNGAAADHVLGQPNFYTNQVTTASANFASTAINNISAVDVTPTPTSLAFDGTNLYVADAVDNRVLVFTPANTSLPDSSVVNWASEIIRQEGVVTIANTSIVANDTVALTLGSNTYTYTVKSGDTNDTIAQGIVSLVSAGSGDTNAIAIFAGTGSGSVYISSKGINLANDTIAFSATASNTTDLTVTVSGNGYLSAGTAATGAPGMLVEINGANLSDQPTDNPAVASLTGTIPYSLGGAQVFMDGVATPVYSASATQVVSQIPYTIEGRNSTSIFVRTTHSDGSVTITNATPIYITQANPGLFSAPASLGQVRPYPATGVYHQLGNPQVVVDLTGTVKAGDTVTITVAGKAYTYTEQSADTLTSITQNVVNAINNGNDPSVTAQVGGAFNRVVVVARQSGAAGTGISVAGSSSSTSGITVTPYTDSTCCNVLNGSPVTTKNPAAPGETVVLSGAGLGQIVDLSGNVIANIATGQPYTGYSINSAAASVSATLQSPAGAAAGEVVSAGLAQGSYGVYQIQLIVPQGQPTDAVTQVYIAQNAFISNTVTIPVGPAVANPNLPPVGSGRITINLDSPDSSTPKLSGTASIAGWIVDNAAVISTVQISVDGVSAGTASYGISRPDVCAHHASTVSCATDSNVGFGYTLDTTQFADGTHNLQVTATDASGSRLTSARSFISLNYGGALPTVIDFDNPGVGNPSFQGLTTLKGWALNTGAIVSNLGLSVDGVFQGNVTYGQSRPDVCAVYATSPGCANGTGDVGWSYLLDTGRLSNGQHTVSLSATTSDGQHAIQGRTFKVANWTTSNPIIASIDKPNGQTGPLSGTTNIGGWALDSASSIKQVSIAIDNIPMGNAAYGGNRADVCAVFQGYPGCPNVGWTYALDTTIVPDGTHTLQVTVTPASGQASTTTTPIHIGNLASAANPTRISIDSPNSTTAAFTGYASFAGWALNDNSAIATVQISIDGVASGTATYSSARPDVCAKLPGRPGCPNVGWDYFFSTADLTNGAHSVEVTATTQNGERATASSSFTVANATSVSPTTAAITEPGTMSSSYQGMAQFSGTATSTSAQVTSITLSVDGFPYGATSFTPSGPNTVVNWTYLFNTTQLADGTHSLGITATAADGSTSVTSTNFQVANWTSPSPTRISIDVPNSSSTNFAAVAYFGGWAINPSSAITGIQVAVDGIGYGPAQYGSNRADVCSTYGNQPGCPDVGWNAAIDTTYLANGTHTLAITATTAAGQSFTTSTSFTVAN